METKIDLADFLQRFSTKVLWHFTGYNKSEDDAFKILLAILQSKKLKISERQPLITMPSQKQRIGYKCSCMCDIPFRDLRIHIIRYGPFGIALYKSSAITSGYFNPVLYMQNNHPLFDRAENLIEELEKISSPHQELDKTLTEFLTLLGTYVKSSNLLSKIHLDPKIDDEQSNNFYYEREWRSAYDWNFQETDVAAIMLPQKYLGDFRSAISGKFPNATIISTEMIESL